MLLASDNLLNIRDETESQKLSEKQVVLFHHLVTHLLFNSNRARQDIQTNIVFLMERVKSTLGEWEKLKRVLKYLNWIKLLALTLETKSTGNMKWYIAASCSTHNVCKGHCCSFMMMGKKTITSFS